tara:strand:- start:124 stop:573 length:450 start_codon:yes stop_codon:yes gene_type:complete
MNKDSIKHYTNSLASDRKTTITQLINVIEQNIPKGFEKVMNYGMPSFVIPHSIYPNGYHCDTTLPLPFIGVSNQKSSISLHHMGLYADPELLNWFKSEYPKHSNTKLDMGKSCIRFKKFNEIPYELIGILSNKMTVKNWIDIYEQNIKR